MPNIFLTNICNNNCSYCFVKNNSNNFESAEKFISFEQYKKTINWMYKNIECPKEDRKLQLLGGEPLLHPEISKLIKFATIKDFDEITIFSNGFLLKEYYEFSKYKNVSFVINVNSQNDIGKEKFEKLKEDINNYPRKENIHCGFTIYNKDMDLESIFDLITYCNIKKIRVAVSVPNEQDILLSTAEEYYLNLKNKYLEAINKCIELNIDFQNDCNGIPTCLYTEEELNFLKKHNVLKASNSYCHNTGDIFLNGMSSPCFGINKVVEGVNIDCFENYYEMINYYNKKKQELEHKFLEEKCKTCEHYLSETCSGGCTYFKLKGVING